MSCISLMQHKAQLDDHIRRHFPGTEEPRVWVIIPVLCYFIHSFYLSELPLENIIVVEGNDPCDLAPQHRGRIRYLTLCP